MFTNIYQVEEHCIDIQNPLWDASLSKLVKTAAFKLGIRPDELSAKLDMLLYMEKGSSIDWCSNVEEDENIIGSMLIQLPSNFKGGKISIFDGDEDVDEENEADFITSFPMGGPNREAEFACHFVCHYSDCQYEIEEITSGSRLLLRYSLLYNGKGDGVIPKADVLRESVIPLKTSLTHLPRADRMILVPLRQDYAPSSLTLSGIDALSSTHRAKAESIRLAGGGNWTVLIMNAFNTYTTTRPTDVGGRSKFQIAAVYDEQGKKVSLTWVKKILNFNPLVEEVDIKEERMLLSTSARLADNWGKRKSRKTKTLHHYDSDSYFGYGAYGYDDHFSYEYTSTYKASFLLAYDRDAVFDLKCVEAYKGSFTGKIVRNDGVIAAAEEVVKKQDYSMLGRLLEVVEFKEELRFETSTCRKLLEMISTDKNCDDTSLASRILGGLSTSAEPDSLLWNTIVLAVRKFNWSELRTIVSSLLCDESRKKTPTRRSRISLTVFLNRIDFCFKLTATKANDESNFPLQCISQSMDDLAGSDFKGVSCGRENFTELQKIDSMVEEHGWKAMKEVVKHSLEFYSSNAPDQILYFIGMGRLVSKLHGNHSCDITLDAMTKFASTFSSKIQKSPDSNVKYSLTSSRLSESLMISIRIVIDHGEQNDMDSVGKKVISRRNIFSSFLKGASEVSNDSIPQTFLLDLLNKLFMQQSIEIDAEVPCACSRNPCECKWNVVSPDNATEDNTTVSPSLHVKLILGANPKLAHMTDKDGRFPLHYAAARGVYETIASVLEANPKAAIVRDPLTGLYPFMLAGSNGNTAAAFELLLLDPNLVLGGIPADEDDEDNDRKRKRSPSM